MFWYVLMFISLSTALQPYRAEAEGDHLVAEGRVGRDGLGLARGGPGVTLAGFIHLSGHNHCGRSHLTFLPHLGTYWASSQGNTVTSYIWQLCLFGYITHQEVNAENNPDFKAMVNVLICLDSNNEDKPRLDYKKKIFVSLNTVSKASL